jgi:F-type H+-transporting ATPase subunit b
VKRMQRRILWMAVLALAMLSSAPRVWAQSAPRAVSSSQAGSPQTEVPEKKEEIKDENYEYMHSAAVTKFGAALGMNPNQASTVFTILNFLIFAIAVGYGLLKLLPKTFRARTSTIQKQLVDARSATEEATARLNSVEARLAKLDDQIEGMRTQAKTDAERDALRMKQTADDEKNKIVAAAEAEIATAGAMVRRDLQRYAAELAVEQAARKLIVTTETDRLLVENFAHKLGAGFGDKAFSDKDKAGQN